MNDVLFPWHPHKKILIYSFVFAFCLHAAFFVFIRHFPAFMKIKRVSPPKLTVHLCAGMPVRHLPCDVKASKPSRFMPQVPPPPKKAAPKKKEITKPKAVHKPKIVKKQPPKKALKRIEKKVPPVTRLESRSALQESAEPMPTGKASVKQSVKSHVPSSPAPVIRSSPGLSKGPPLPPKRQLAYPDYGKNPTLTYPFLARRRGIEGKVVLKVLVSKTGHPLKVVLERSSGSSILDKSAMKAVRNWVFKPGKLNGAAIDMWVRVPVVYALK